MKWTQGHEPPALRMERLVVGLVARVHPHDTRALNAVTDGVDDDAFHAAELTTSCTYRTAGIREDHHTWRNWAWRVQEEPEEVRFSGAPAL